MTKQENPKVDDKPKSDTNNKRNLPEKETSNEDRDYYISGKLLKDL